VASTDVRRAVGEGDRMVLEAAAAPPVAEYILKYGLYRKAEENETGRTDAGNK